MILDNENNESSGLGSSFGYAAPFVIPYGVDNKSSKLSHDEYRVFVNGDYIGQKVLLSENEKPQDLDKYLSSQGFENFKTEVNGGNLIIHCSDEIEEMENILEGYLNTR